MTHPKCPKCAASSGDNWPQCEGSCPMPSSPHYKTASLHKTKDLTQNGDTNLYSHLNSMNQVRNKMAMNYEMKQPTSRLDDITYEEDFKNGWDDCLKELSKKAMDNVNTYPVEVSEDSLEISGLDDLSASVSEGETIDFVDSRVLTYMQALIVSQEYEITKLEARLSSVNNINSELKIDLNARNTLIKKSIGLTNQARKKIISLEAKVNKINKLIFGLILYLKQIVTGNTAKKAMAKANKIVRKINGHTLAHKKSK
jgi:hypothetical protein